MNLLKKLIYREPPLHSSIREENLVLAQKLIKQGANINAGGSSRSGNPTPLHVAVQANNLEAVCMLLFYGADVSILCEGRSPIDMALKFKYYPIVEVLVDHYENNQIINGLISCYVAGTFLETIQKTTSGSSVDDTAIVELTPIFKLLFLRESFHLFQIVWPKVTDNMLHRMTDPLLYTFFRTCNYPRYEFLECSYLILGSNNVHILVEQFNSSPFYFWELLEFIDRTYHRIPQNDLVCLIYALLSYGIYITLQDFVYVFNNFGYNQELMALLYGGCLLDKSHCIQRYSMLPLISFIFVLEKNGTRKTVFKMFKNIIFHSFCVSLASVLHFLYCLRFFSFSYPAKEKMIYLIRSHVGHYTSIIQRISEIPTVPSLLELGRNHTRQFLKKKFKVKNAYQFHDIVKNLNVPEVVKNILIFRTPIYD